MNKLYVTIAIATLTLAAVAMYGCTSWLQDAATNAAKDAEEAARCAKENAPPDTPEVMFATAKAKDAEKFAQAAADNDPQKKVDEANAKVKEANDAVAAAEAALTQAQNEATEASKNIGSAQKAVDGRASYQAAKAELDEADKARQEAAKAGSTEDNKIAYDAAKARYANANALFITADLQYAAATPDAHGPDDRNRVADEAQAYINNAEAKKSVVEDNQKELETKKKQAAEAQTQAQNASKVAEAFVEANARAADKAADEAAHYAAKIPACRAKMQDLRKEAFGGKIRPAGIDIYGNRIPRPGAPGSPGGPSAPAGHGGGPEG